MVISEDLSLRLGRKATDNGQGCLVKPSNRQMLASARTDEDDRPILVMGRQATFFRRIRRKPVQSIEEFDPGSD